MKKRTCAIHGKDDLSFLVGIKPWNVLFSRLKLTFLSENLVVNLNVYRNNLQQCWTSVADSHCAPNFWLPTWVLFLCGFPGFLLCFLLEDFFQAFFSSALMMLLTVIAQTEIPSCARFLLTFLDDFKKWYISKTHPLTNSLVFLTIFKDKSKNFFLQFNQKVGVLNELN